MSDHHEKRSEKNDAGRSGFGDDQGTRVGSPTPETPRNRDRDSDRVPSRVSDSFRASARDADREDGDSTGAGAEAAEGVHASRDRDPRNKSALEDVDTGRRHPDEGTVERAGSEPLGRERQHQSGYGGKGGEPRTSSDTREPMEPTGEGQ